MTLRQVLTGWILAGVCTLAGAAPQATPQSAASKVEKPEPVIMLKVNGRPLSVQDYASFLQRNQAYVQAAMTSDEGKKRAIQAMIGATLMHEDLLTHKDWVPDGDKSSKEVMTAAYQKLGDLHFPRPAEPAEEALYAYYQAHEKDFGIPETVRLSQIQIVLPEKATDKQKAEAKARADKALERVKAGEDFGTVAAQLTENKLARLPRGDLGYMSMSQNEWLMQAVQGLKVGEHTAVLTSPVGYEILLLTDRRAAIASPYANVRQKIIHIMTDEAVNQARDAYMASLATKARIEILQPELKELFPNGVVITPPPAGH